MFVIFLGITSVTSWIQLGNNEDQPNIIIYLADDQDQLDYGVYGNPNVVTTNVDKLASEGMKFLNFTLHKLFVPLADHKFSQACIRLKMGVWQIILV